MAATIFSIEAAKQANFNLTEGDKGKGLIHQAVVTYRANRRSGTACAKTRNEVSGSGKKLWNQKGTGNARMGSVRSPIWRGGGVVWGPRPRDYSKALPPKMKRLAFRAALTARISDGDVLTIPSFSISDGKTKSFVAQVKTITDAKKIMIIGTFDESTFRSARNVQYVQLARPEEVNAENLLNYAKVVVTGDALDILAKRTATD
jgi:large subunit ribosomal protein L4